MKKVQVYIPDELLKDIDVYCSKYHIERSEFIRSVVRDTVYFGKEKVKIIENKEVKQEEKQEKAPQAFSSIGL